MGIEVESELAPSVQKKCILAGSRGASFEAASQELADQAELTIHPKRIERLVRQIGEERRQQEQQQVEAFEALPLPAQKQPPCQGVEEDEVIAAGFDGARMQILDSILNASSPDPSPSTLAGSPLDEAAACEDSASSPKPRELSPEETHVEPAEASRSPHWRESKIGCLMKFKSQPSEEDPQPQIPDPFVEPQRMHRLAREIGHPATGVAPPVAGASSAETASSDTSQALLSGESEPATGKRTKKPKPEERLPKRVFRKVAATRQSYDVLGRLLKCWCWMLGYSAVPRKAFLGDGDHKIWKLQKQHFSSFTPILDFVHAISYVYQAAMSGQPAEVGWSTYLRWSQWLWSGEVDRLLNELRSRGELLGPLQKSDASTSPRYVVQRALTYLSNHQDKMKYSEYRRAGLPITTCNVESTVKQVNRRVKGTEKFWSPQGAESILQVRADDLSDDAPLDTFWNERAKRMTGFRKYKKRGNCATAA